MPLLQRAKPTVELSSPVVSTSQITDRGSITHDHANIESFYLRGFSPFICIWAAVPDDNRGGGNSATDGTFPVTSLNCTPERSAEQHTPHSFARN